MSTTALRRETSRISATLSGNDPQGLFGYFSAIVGDVNADGFDDFTAGAPESIGGDHDGRAFFYTGGASGLTFSNELVSQTGQNGNWFGGCAIAGDVNGDGVLDALIAYSVGGTINVYLGAAGKPISAMSPQLHPLLPSFHLLPRHSRRASAGAPEARMTDPGTGDLEPGQLVDGKYRIERLLGRGGMGAVYTARHELLAQTVALKVVLPEIAANQEVVGRFLNEARSAAGIESDHVARVMDVARLPDGTPYMVMEFLTGCDLDEHLAKSGPLPPEVVADLLLQALDGVAHAHAIGIVHRDLKPANLFLAQKPGRSIRVKVLDFGIAKALEGSALAASNVTSTKSILGSPAFMAPEQLRSSKRVDARADIWSLGVIAYQLSTGRLPYEAEDVGGLFASILEDTPVAPRQHRPELPETFEAIVLRCLAKKPDDCFRARWPSRARSRRSGRRRRLGRSKRFGGWLCPCPKRRPRLSPPLRTAASWTVLRRLTPARRRSRRRRFRRCLSRLRRRRMATGQLPRSPSPRDDRHPCDDPSSLALCGPRRRDPLRRPCVPRGEAR